MLVTKVKRPISKVFLHCSASDNPAHDDAAVIEEWHIERGFTGIGYHYFIQADGTVQVGRPLERVPAAQEGHNAGSIAICLHGLTNFTDAQYDALRALCGDILMVYPNVTFHGHKEVNRHKTCPVYNYKKVLNLDVGGKMRGINTENEV